MAPIKIFTLGNTGVVIDQQVLNPATPDDSLKFAQNTTHDPRKGRSSAITKRPGLARFNTEFAGGVILGGIPMPVAGFGGAPASGGGAIVGTGDEDNGSSIGTGDMRGAPGAPFDGGVATTTPAGAGIFGGGSGGSGTIFSGARLFLVGRLGSDATVGQEGGSGWYVSSKGLADTATIRITPGPPIAVYDFPPTAEFLAAWGAGPSCVDNIGTTGLYYAAAYGNQVDGTNKTIQITPGVRGNPIRNTNGGTDILVATIPVGSTRAMDTFPVVVPPGSIRSAITFMHYGVDGFIYVGVKDKYNGQSTAGSIGRVFRLSPLTGALTEWIMLQSGEGDGHTFEHIPYCGCFFDGYLYVGTFPDAINESADLRATNGTAVAPALGGSFAPTGSATNYAFHSSLAIYNGRLFLGTGVWETTPHFAAVWSRQPGTPPVGFSPWTETFVTSGGVATNGNYVPSMAVFNGALYAQYYNPSGPTAKVYKIAANNPGDPLSTSFTVTTSLAAMNGIPHYLVVDDGVLYAIGAGDTFATSAWVTTDGTTWTEKTGNLPAGATSSRIRPIFFGVNQS